MHSLHYRTLRCDDWTIRFQTKNVYIDAKKSTQLNACLRTGSVVITLKCTYVHSICHHNTPYGCVGHTFRFRSRLTCVTLFVSCDWPWRPVTLYTVHVTAHADLHHTVHDSCDWPCRAVSYFTRFMRLSIQTCAILYKIHVTAHTDLCHTLYDSCDWSCRPAPHCSAP